MLAGLELEGEVDPHLIRETFRTQILSARDEHDALLYPELGWTIKEFMGFPFWAEATIIENPVSVVKGDFISKEIYFNC